MTYQLPANLFAPAAVVRNQESSRCVLLSKEALKAIFVAIARRVDTDDEGVYSEDYELIVRQKPVAAKVFIGKEKDRKPVDPPPIIQLRVSESVDSSQNYLQSPYFFISCSLLDNNGIQSQAERERIKHGLAGTLVSSLHRLKDTDNTDGGFFVFGDLSVKVEGTFRLQFTLYEVRDKEVAYIKSVVSESFNVYASKNWPGMAESTILTRSFSDQGVRLRLRKEPRSRLGARGPASDNYEPRRYKIQNRRQGQPESHHSQQPQQIYHWAQEGGGSQGQAPIDYPARQPKQQLPSPSSVSSTYQRKRDYAHPSLPGPNASHGEDSFSKRTRRDSEYNQQQNYSIQQYSSSPDYGGRLYPLPTQTAGLAYPSSPHALYNSSYSSSPLSMTSREQPNYSTSRRADNQLPSVSSTYELSGGRVSSVAQQRFPSAYEYTNPFQPSSQPFNPLQPLQSQFIPQLSQPVLPIRATSGMPVYGMHLESDQTSMLPRPNILMSSEMPPPTFGRTSGLVAGTPHSGAMLPSMEEDLKYSRTHMFDTRPRNNNNANR